MNSDSVTSRSERHVTKVFLPKVQLRQGRGDNGEQITVDLALPLKN